MRMRSALSGKELHERLRKLATHVTAVGTNSTGQSKRITKRWVLWKIGVLVSARKFAELGASVAEDIPQLEPIETSARALSFEWDDEPTEISSGDRKAG